MHITFILPGIGKRDGEPYIKSWKMEPLMMAYLAALTPPELGRDFFDDRVELIDFGIRTDLVAITVETYTARRAYDIAAKFRARGVPVVLGGYHVTLNPDEAREHADAIVIGEAETVWAGLLEDLAKGKLQPEYRGDGEAPWILCDRSVYARQRKTRRYTPLTLVETSRGCGFHCSFCAIRSFYGGRYRMRPVADVVDEIRSLKKKYIFFIDDNFFGNTARTKELLRALIPLRILWSTQGTLLVAKDPELLDLMRESGCIMLLVGFESLSGANLEQMDKGWMNRIEDRDALVRAIHGRGVNMYATFVFGFDHDTEATFREAIDFALRHRFFFAAFNHLLPWPGTPLYASLETEGRLLQKRWWLEPEYRYGDYAYEPKLLDRVRFKALCTGARHEFFSLRNIFRRGAALLRRTWSPLLHYIFWSQNLLLRKEVERKLAVPIGRGLDRMPK